MTVSNLPPSSAETGREAVAYGLRLRGLDPSAWLATSVAPHLPVVTVIPSGPRAPGGAHGPDAQRATLDLGSDGARLVLNRSAATARFGGPKLPPDDLAHPYLGPVGSLFGRWLGRESHHAGAFVAAGRAWALTGPKEAGKSTLLAALAGAGFRIVADDLLLSDGTVAFAGPRALDPREPPAPPLADRLPCAVVRGGQRWRLLLPDCNVATPLGGWIHLSWGDRLGTERLTAAERLRRLAAGRGWPSLPSDPTVLLALAATPAWRLTRPHRRRALGDTVALLAELTDRAAQRLPLRAAGQPDLLDEQRRTRERPAA